MFKDVENISLTAISSKSDTNIISQFTCKDVNCTISRKQNNDLTVCQGINYCGNYKTVDGYDGACCSVIRMVNVTHACVNGMSIDMNLETNLRGIRGITVQKSYNVRIQMDISCTPTNNTLCNWGILAVESSHLFVDGMQTRHQSIGMMLHSTINTTINNSLFLNGLEGVHLFNTTTTNLLNTTISNNDVGMTLNKARNTKIEKMSLTYYRSKALSLQMCFNTYITDIYASSNDALMFPRYCKETQTKIITGRNDITISYSTHVAINNAVLSYNRSAVTVDVSEHIHLRNITLYSSNDDNLGGGITMASCTNTTMEYVYSHSSCNQMEIEVYTSTYTSILHALLTSNRYGIRIKASTHLLLVNISITNSQTDGIYIGMLIETSSKITIKNISVSLFRRTGLDFYKCSNATLEHSTFSTLYSTTKKQRVLQSAVVSIKYTSFTMSYCAFIKNTISSILSVSSNITLRGNLVFANNQALYGAVFILTKSSVLILSESCTATFHNNSALDHGGVFYIFTEEFIVRSKTLFEIQTIVLDGTEFTSRTNCFVQVEGARSRKLLMFAGNTAGKGGDVLFGGLVALGLDGDVNCLDSFKNISDLAKQQSAACHLLRPISRLSLSGVTAGLSHCGRPYDAHHLSWTDSSNTSSGCRAGFWHCYWVSHSTTNGAFRSASHT